MTEELTNVLRRGQDPGDRLVPTPRGRATDQPTDPRSELSDPPDADPVETIMVLWLRQTVYQTALAATARVVQASLLDFLR
jgi:hypothetical protein